MGAMSNLMVQIREEIEFGFMSFDQIATKYEVPRSWVDEVAADMIAEAAAEFDGQPDEAQEWESFDPDC